MRPIHVGVSDPGDLVHYSCLQYEATKRVASQFQRHSVASTNTRYISDNTTGVVFHVVIQVGLHLRNSLSTHLTSIDLYRTPTTQTKL